MERDGSISQNAFPEWYLEWLFGDGSDDEDEHSDDAGEEGGAAVATSEEKSVGGWGSRFTIEEGSWKCESCMVQNKKDATKCAACEASRPGHESMNSNEAGKSSTSREPSSIGAGGFSFGGAGGASTIGAGGFKFGGVPGSSAGSAPPLSAAKTSAAPVPAFGSGGFSFGTVLPATDTGNAPSASPGGFKFGGSSSEKSAPAKATAVASAQGGYPPMSATAPKPFGGGDSKPTGSGSSKSASPPVAAKAPTPFGGGPKPVETKHSAGIVKQDEANAVSTKGISSGKTASTLKAKAKAKDTKAEKPANPFANVQLTAPKPSGGFSFGASAKKTDGAGKIASPKAFASFSFSETPARAPALAGAGAVPPVDGFKFGGSVGGGNVPPGGFMFGTSDASNSLRYASSGFAPGSKAIEVIGSQSPARLQKELSSQQTKSTKIPIIGRANKPTRSDSRFCDEGASVFMSPAGHRMKADIPTSNARTARKCDSSPVVSFEMWFDGGKSKSSSDSSKKTPGRKVCEGEVKSSSGRISGFALSEKKRFTPERKATKSIPSYLRETASSRNRNVNSPRAVKSKCEKCGKIIESSPFRRPSPSSPASVSSSSGRGSSPSRFRPCVSCRSKEAKSPSASETRGGRIRPGTPKTPQRR
uniref:Nuclear pore complex protein Nup153 n=1 Tax=Odontella aurita TaxID=265563 RepID=A0A7S4IIV8_9STRA